MEKQMWGIHAGPEGIAHSLFINKKVIAIGWPKLGDLSTYCDNKDSLRQSIEKNYPETKPGAIGGQISIYQRFCIEMHPGDLVVYPARPEKKVYIGEITGPYLFDQKKDAHFPHQRSVKWLNSFPRTKFSQGALYEIGAAQTLFKVKNYASEFLAALEGKPIETDDGDDATISHVAKDIEQNTRDFILKTLCKELKGHPFTDLVGHILNLMGYQTRVSHPGVDGGIDIIAHKDDLGFEPPLIKVQVKSSEGSFGHPVVTALYGNVDEREFGLFVTLGEFTKQARDFDKNKSNLRLIDGDTFVDLILKYYEKLDPKYQGILPLKHIYVPEAKPEQEE